MRSWPWLLLVLVAACAPGGPAPRPGFDLALPAAALTTTPTPAPDVTPSIGPSPASDPTRAPVGAPQLVAGAEAAGYADGPAALARFSDPQGLALAADGALLVADRLNHRVRRVAADGTVSTLAGSDAAGFLDGPVAAARFQEPTSLAVDEHGTVFVADPFNHRVRRIAPDDHGELAVATLVGGDAAGSQDGPPAAFDHPYALALDGRHHLFVAERFGQTLRMITLDATGRATAVRTVAGAYEQAGAADGVGAAARFSRPVALAWDPRVADHTALYVAGDLRCALRRVDVDAAGVATVTTLNGADASCGYADGAIGAMRFDRPQALLVDPARGLLLADAGNQALRLVANAVSTPLGGPGKPPFQGPAGLALAPGGGLYVADGNRVRRVAF